MQESQKTLTEIYKSNYKPLTGLNNPMIHIPYTVYILFICYNSKVATSLMYLAFSI